MIKDRKPLAMYEADQLLDSVKETDKTKDIKGFIKKFSKLSNEKSKKLAKELTDLDIIKLKQSDIVKITDVVPENAAELNKLFTEVSLDADETNKILEAIKNNK